MDFGWKFYVIMVVILGALIGLYLYVRSKPEE